MFIWGEGFDVGKWLRFGTAPLIGTMTSVRGGIFELDRRLSIWSGDFDLGRVEKTYAQLRQAKMYEMPHCANHPIHVKTKRNVLRTNEI